MAEVVVGHQQNWPTGEIELLGHTGSVRSVAFSPDGTRIVSGSFDNTVRVWNAERGVQIGSPLQGHTDYVTSVAFSPDGTRIVSGSYDQTVRVWDAERSVQIGSPLQGHTHCVRSVAFSLDGTRIVSGSDDKTVRVWDAEKHVQIGSPLQGHTDQVTSVAFSPDSTRIVSGSFDNTVKVWDAKRGVQIGSPLQGHTHSFRSVAFSPDFFIKFSSSNAHALCEPHEFLYDATVRQFYVECPVLLCKDGWVRGPKGRLLLWVPHALRQPFYSMQTVVVIPSGACIELDLSKMVHGTRWQMCFNGNLPTCRSTE
ncbi:hypothetical protein ID866_8610 [Astraeus odoratus]|nr:hypothetical protein ID866_8610 [Astraeus odoratus]